LIYQLQQKEERDMSEKYVNYTFEFCPDTTEQEKRVEKLRPGTLSDCREVCERHGVRARVLKSGSYHAHIFEDGSISYK
jgi:hypothetical protein